jgi:SAM-dependent methyltransferase
MYSRSIQKLDPVDAYTAIADHYQLLSKARKPYLDAIDRMVIDAIAQGADSLLDVGAGDGRRTRKIAAAAAIRNFVLLEPSLGMRRIADNACEKWETRAEDLGNSTRKFAVIVCLWNVLGHIASPEKRESALRNIRQALAPGGLLFIDVINRYNVGACGFTRILGRMVHDRIFPSRSNGDVAVHWNLGPIQVNTYGHVFTRNEMSRLFQRAQLRIKNECVIDYQTGELKSSHFRGNLFYVLEADGEGTAMRMRTA